MDKQSKAPGVYRVILCVLTLALAPVFYAIWQPYNTCLLQLPAAGGAWQLLTRLLYYVLFSLLLAGICRSSLGSKTVAPFGAKPWLRTVVIAEAGNVYAQPNEIEPTDVKASIGVGVRLRLPMFVNVQLEAGVAFPVAGGAPRFFAGQVN